jgi:hypothetical protein
VVIFLLLDKTDDYQLCAFVIDFKASLFVAGGLYSAFVSTSLYIACIELDDCHAGGAPGSRPAGFEFGLVGALLQAVVCWIAMGMLPWARPKGGRLYELPPARERHGAAYRTVVVAKGGRLWPLMIYDMAVLLACVGGSAYIWWGMTDPEYLLRARVYHIRMLYSVLAFPWVILKIPLAYTFVLHLKPTAYNQRGDLAPLANARQRRAARERRHGQVHDLGACMQGTESASGAAPQPRSSNAVVASAV